MPSATPLPYHPGASISRAFQVYRRDWAKYLLAGVGFMVLVDALAIVLPGASGVGTGIAGTILSGMMVMWSSDEYHAGSPEERKRLGDDFGTGRLIGTSFVCGLTTILGLVLLIIPGLVIGAAWCLHQPLIVREKAEFGESLSRSWQLVRPHLWAVIGTWLLLLLILIAVLFVNGVLQVALDAPDGWTDTDWRTLVCDVVTIGPVFALAPLTAAAIYEQLSGKLPSSANELVSKTV